jgi:hypothetical protein
LILVKNKIDRHQNFELMGAVLFKKTDAQIKGKIMKNIGLLALILGFQFLAHAELPTNYINLSSLEKQNILYSNSARYPYTKSEMDQQEDPGALEKLKLFSTTYLKDVFLNDNDEFEFPKTKLIHTYGSVAKIEFKITNPLKYTGLFQSGAKGIIRLSLVQLEGSFTPGMAIKLLVDGQKSQSIFAMHSLDGQGENRNFFEHLFTSKIPKPISEIIQVLASRFKETLIELDAPQKEPTYQPVSELSRITKTGSEVNQPHEPFSLVFEPTSEVQMSSDVTEFRFELTSKRYSKGQVLYNVYAKEFENSSPELIGKVTLESSFVSSEYADTELFFQHHML